MVSLLTQGPYIIVCSDMIYLWSDLGHLLVVITMCGNSDLNLNKTKYNVQGLVTLEMVSRHYKFRVISLNMLMDTMLIFWPCSIRGEYIRFFKDKYHD